MGNPNQIPDNPAKNSPNVALGYVVLMWVSNGFFAIPCGIPMVVCMCFLVP